MKGPQKEAKEIKEPKKTEEKRGQKIRNKKIRD